MTDLRLDVYYIKNHPQKEMENLGITYKQAIPQSVSDQWWFRDCENLPAILPEFLKVMNPDIIKRFNDGVTE